MPENRNGRALILLAFAAILTVAASSQLVGANLTLIAHDFSRPRGALLARAHLATGLGFFVSVFLWAALSERWNHKWVLWLTMAICLAGASASGAAQLPALLILGSVLLAASTAGVESTAAILLGEVRPHRRALLINFSQAVFAVGAGASPFAVAWLLHSGFSWHSTFFMITPAAAVLLLLLPFARFTLTPPSTPRTRFSAVSRLLRDHRFLWLLLAICFYVGIETGASALSPQYFEEVWRISPTHLLSKVSISVFWLAMVPGRILAGLLASRFGEHKTICASLILAALFQALFLLAPTPASGLVFIGLSGFAQAGVWPTMISAVSSLFTDLIPTRIALMVGVAGAGFGIFEALLGSIYDLASSDSTRSQGISTTFSIIPLFALLSLAFYLLAIRPPRHPDSRHRVRS